MEIQDFEISMLQISLQDNFYSLPNFYTFLKSRHFKNFLRESFRFDIYIYISFCIHDFPNRVRLSEYLYRAERSRNRSPRVRAEGGKVWKEVKIERILTRKI